MIAKSDFFQTIMSLSQISNIQDGIKQGDVIDLMKDIINEQVEDLKRFKDKPNKEDLDLCRSHIKLDHIQNRLARINTKWGQCRIQFKSKVKEFCDSEIMSLTPKPSNKGGKGSTSKGPPKDFKSICLDVFCWCVLQNFGTDLS